MSKCLKDFTPKEQDFFYKFIIRCAKENGIYSRFKNDKSLIPSDWSGRLKDAITSILWGHIKKKFAMDLCCNDTESSILASTFLIEYSDMFYNYESNNFKEACVEYVINEFTYIANLIHERYAYYEDFCIRNDIKERLINTWKAYKDRYNLSLNKITKYTEKIMFEFFP